MIELLSKKVVPLIVGIILALFKQWLENRRK